MFEDYIYQLDQLRTSHRSLVGDKALYLGLLAQRGYPVIPGLVISAEAFQSSLEQAEWSEPMFADLPHSSLHVDVDNSRQLQAIAQQLRRAIQSSPLPDIELNDLEALVQSWQASALILRPSIALPAGLDPTISLKTTGLFASQVCRPTQAAIIHSLKQVWSELFRARSLLYWQRLRIELQQISLAVLIQPVQTAIASGDAYIQGSQLNIRAVWGLGRALVNGEVLPERYQVDLKTGRHTHHLGNQPFIYQTASSTDAPPDALLMQTDGCYQAHLLDLSQPTQDILSKAHLQQLIQLTQRVSVDLGAFLELEWVFSEVNGVPSFFLTQVIPHLNGRLWGDSEPVEASPSTESTGDTSAPTPPPLLAGLAAAPGQTIARAWILQDGTLPQPNLVGHIAGQILVATQITPDWSPWLKHVKGVITEQGGQTSHAAVVAREIGIPAITGVANATQLLQTGDRLFLNGDRGEVYRVEESSGDSFNKLLGESSGESGVVSSHPGERVTSTSLERFSHDSDNPLIATQLFVTLSQISSLTAAAQLPVDGVGLVRSELMSLDVLENRHPGLWLQQGQHTELTVRLADQIQKIAHAFAPRPVFYRSLDLRSHEFANLEGYPVTPERNPILGMHGSLSYQTNPDLFDVELSALHRLQQQGYTNLHLILPFVRTVEEFTFCRQRVQRMGLMQHHAFQLWIMAEVPSVLLLLPDYIKAGVQGVAIGSNDLTQLILAIDRDHAQMATAFDQRHPAVMRAIQQIIQMARSAQIPCTICGQAPETHPDVIDSLVRWGITAISVEPNKVNDVYEAIVRAEQRLLLEAARQKL